MSSTIPTLYEGSNPQYIAFEASTLTITPLMRFAAADFFHVVKRHFQQYFSYTEAISFIGGGNRRIRRKPLALIEVRTHSISGDRH